MNTNAYDTLYNNMKQRFTVVSGENEYSLGKYMLMKAKEKSGKTSLPAAVSEQRPTALRSVFSYIGEKLAVKDIPLPEKIIKAFPKRTALSAVCSALLICTLTFSFGALSGLLPAQGEGGSYIAMSEKSTEEADGNETVSYEEKF